MSDLQPNQLNKRSPAYRQITAAQYLLRDGGALVAKAGGGAEAGAEESATQAARCALLDLSVLSRTGLRGPTAAAVMQQQGLPLPEKPNQAVAGPGDELILRLGKTEAWVLASLHGGEKFIAALELQANSSHDCYPLYCQDSHCWFMLTGRHLPDIMAKICGVDLRNPVFPAGTIAQTSVARVNAIVVHHKVNAIPVFSILSDSASAEYLWQALLDAVAEFDGRAVGINALLQAGCPER